jgi:hypothetical protein
MIQIMFFLFISPSTSSFDFLQMVHPDFITHTSEDRLMDFPPPKELLPDCLMVVALGKYKQGILPLSQNGHESSTYSPGMNNKWL